MFDELLLHTFDGNYRSATAPLLDAYHTRARHTTFHEQYPNHLVVLYGHPQAKEVLTTIPICFMIWPQKNNVIVSACLLQLV